MALKPFAAPTVPPITLARAKAHLRVDHGDDDTVIAFLVDAVLGQIDGKTGWLNRALITQTWDLVLDAFPCGVGAIKIPLPPLQSVSFVQYYDTSGDLQTVSADDYKVDDVNEPGWVIPYDISPWPATLCAANAVTIRFVAGYGDAESDVPATIRSWMLLIVGSLYANRESVVDGRSQQPIALPDHILNMLSTFRAY